MQVNSAMDPLTIIAGIEQFGLAADGSDLRDLKAALATVNAEPVGGSTEIIKGLRFAASTLSNRLQQVDAIDKAIAYLSAPQASAPVAVRVKALEWVEARMSDRWPRFTALTEFGYYEVLEWSNGGFGGSFPADAKDDEGAPTEFHATSIEDAKAAAQADYERRIRSALVAPPAQEAVGYLVKGFDGEPFYSPSKEPYKQQGHAIVPVYTAPPAVPEGMVLVPVEPTNDMVYAAFGSASTEVARDIYRAMLTAFQEGRKNG